MLVGALTDGMSALGADVFCPGAPLPVGAIPTVVNMGAPFNRPNTSNSLPEVSTIGNSCPLLNHVKNHHSNKNPPNSGITNCLNAFNG